MIRRRISDQIRPVHESMLKAFKMTERIIIFLVYLYNALLALYNCSIKFGYIEESEVVKFLDYYLIRKVMHNKVQFIFRKRSIHLISARPRASSEVRIDIKRYINIQEKRWSQLRDLILEYFGSMTSRDQSTLQRRSVFRFCIIGSNRGQHFYEKEVIAYRKFLEHSWITKDCSTTTLMVFLNIGLLLKGYSLICDKTMTKRKAKSNDISGVNFPKCFFKICKGLNFNDRIATYEDLFPKTYYTLKMLGMKKSKDLKSYTTEGKEYGLIRYPQRRQQTRLWKIPQKKTKNTALEDITKGDKRHGFGRYRKERQLSEMPIIALPLFPEKALIPKVLLPRSFVKLSLKIKYKQSQDFIMKTIKRNNWNLLGTYKSVAKSFTRFFNDMTYYLNCNKYVSDIFYIWSWDQSFNLQDIDKNNKRGPDTITTTGNGIERKTGSLNEWIKLFALSFVFASFAFSKHCGELETFYQSSVKRDGVSYISGKCFDFNKVAIAPFEDFYEKVKDTIFSSNWKPYIHNVQCFVYTVHMHTTNLTQGDVSATESRQSQEPNDVTEINTTEESRTEPEASGPILESIPRRVTLPGLSLPRRSRISTDDDRGNGTTAVERSVDHIANNNVEHETVFGLNLWENAASAENNLSPSAGTLRAVVNGIESPRDLSLPRRPRRSTDHHRGNRSTALEISVDDSANIEDVTDFVFPLGLNPTSASNNDRQRASSTTWNHTTLYAEHWNTESEHSMDSEPDSLHFWDNGASARNTRSRRTGQSAGALLAVNLGVESSLGGTFSTSQSVTGDTLNPVLHVDLNEAITLRVTGNDEEMQTFPPTDIDVNPHPMRRSVNRRLGRVLREPISTSKNDEQSMGISDSMIILRVQGDVHEMLNFEQEDIFIHPSNEEG